MEIKTSGQAVTKPRKQRYKPPATPDQKARESARNKLYRETHQVEIKARRKATDRDKIYRESHPDKVRAGQRAYYATHTADAKVRNNRKRARLRGCKIAPNISAETYAQIMAGDPACTYCPAPATTVDHVWPFDLFGAETEANLVPACGACNYSKLAKPLDEWRWGRVEYGRLHSPKVAAELARLEAQEWHPTAVVAGTPAARTGGPQTRLNVPLEPVKLTCRCGHVWTTTSARKSRCAACRTEKRVPVGART